MKLSGPPSHCSSKKAKADCRVSGWGQRLFSFHWPLVGSADVPSSVRTVLTGNDSKASVSPALETLEIVEVEQLLDTDD
ncbi:hypothetical protein QL285_009658 [Trifolium repens]|nr:hypothetical protein QL285_009658 [Trifolium repens]